MADDTTPVPDASGDAGDRDSLLSRLRVIEDQALDQRATAYAAINDQLQHTLESGDSAHQPA